MGEPKKWFGLMQKDYGLVHVTHFDEDPTVEFYLNAVGEPYSCEIEDFSLVELDIKVLREL